MDYQVLYGVILLSCEDTAPAYSVPLYNIFELVRNHLGAYKFAVCFEQNYFGCFFALPIVVSSIRWGVAAGRKTMVWCCLCFTISGGVLMPPSPPLYSPRMVASFWYYLSGSNGCAIACAIRTCKSIDLLGKRRYSSTTVWTFFDSFLCIME